MKHLFIYFILINFFLTSLWAQTPTPNRGLTPPGTGFGGNPFVQQKTPHAGEDLFEDDDFFDDEEADDISDQILRQRAEQRLRERAATLGNAAGGNAPGGNAGGAARNRVDFSRASDQIGATSLRPGANAQIISGEGGKNCLRLDPESGHGPDVITNFDFPDADIMEIAKTLGRLTCLNFLFDKDVKGRISIVSNSPITVGDAWKAFLTALDVNGFSIIPSGKYMRIARQRDAKDKQIKIYSGEFTPNNDSFITRVIPMKYISAEEVRRVFATFMPPNTRMVAYDQTNTLIITDTGSNIKRLLEMIKVLDVEGFDEKLEVIRIKYASAQDIAKLIDQLLPGNKGGVPGAPPGGRFGFAVRKTKEGGVISHIIPDDRTNSVIVSANGKGLEQVKILIKQLDAKVSVSQGGSKIHVVYLQFADAEQVAQTLNNLAQTTGQKAPMAGGAAAPAQLFEGAIRISADKPTNSLVITGTPSDFGTVSRVISKLDVPRDQVYVEAVIMEMTLDKQFELGTSVALPTSGVGFLPNDDLASFLLNPFSTKGLVMGFQQGATRQITFPGASSPITVASIQGLIKALQQNTNANVLATPQILTLDNQEAQIEIAENIPIPSVTAVQGAGVSQSITREKIALSLKIKPQINKISNFVKLDIDQKQEDISNRTPPAGVADKAFSTQSRAQKTTVVIQDGDTVALGGLVRDKVEEQSIKVPLLGDIPLLGWLFRSKRTASTKQNMIVFITPKIIKQYQHIRKILDKKIRERDEFIEKNLGGNDSFQEYKMGIIKNLPPADQLRSGERVDNTEIEVGEEPEGDFDPANPGQNYVPLLKEGGKKHGLKAEAPQAQAQEPTPTAPVQETAPVSPTPAAPPAPNPASPTTPANTSPPPAAGGGSQ